MASLQLPRTSRWTVLALAIAAMMACRPAAAPENGAGRDNIVENRPADRTLPLPQPPIDRAALLAAVAHAASAEAAGTNDSAEQRALDGRQFEFRIRFGCRGPAPDLARASLGWSFDAVKRTLRIRAAPTISLENEPARTIAGEIEAVEGFWIPRPWLLNPVCPAAAAVQSAPVEEKSASEVPDGQQPEGDLGGAAAVSRNFPKVGIAQFHTAADPRTERRRSRPYEAVQTLDEGQPLSAGGFNLVLSGRLRAHGGTRVIHCISSAAEAAPDCIVSVEIDRVWIERPRSREIIAEWSRS